MRKSAKPYPKPMATPITSALDFLRIKKEIAKHIEIIAEDCGMFDELCEKDQKTFAVFIENIVAFKTMSVIELIAREKARLHVAGHKIDLTERQALIIDDIIEHKTNKEIGVHLGYAASTIHHEVTAILAHFKVKDRENLIKYALAARQETAPPVA